MASATDNTEWPKNIASNYVTCYYVTTSVTVSNTSYDVCYSTDSGWPSVDYYGYGRNSDIWNPPPFAPKIDIKRDRPNQPLVHNRSRHIAPMHFRHVRTQQRKV